MCWHSVQATWKLQAEELDAEDTEDELNNDRCSHLPPPIPTRSLAKESRHLRPGGLNVPAAKKRTYFVLLGCAISGTARRILLLPCELFVGTLSLSSRVMPA